MPDGSTDQLHVTVHDRIADIDAAAWDACAGPDNPFVSHAYLDALEQSGSATAATGWRPCHLLARNADGLVVGGAPLYLKTHSYGEYVFDWGWAEAWQRAGGRYYPKLQGAIPFTPVTGPRLLTRPGPNAPEHARALAATLIELAKRLGVSSAHITFPTQAEAELLERQGFLIRQGFQYHWTNAGYGGFDDFLAALAARKRKQVKRERAAIASSGVRVSTLVGADVKTRHWDAFHRFYERTVDRKWGGAYLTREFLDRLSASPLGERVVLIWAEEADATPVAAAFNMLGGDTLYGRTWGAAREIPFLHFESCYYRALDFAIAHGLARVEAGAQGEHKVSRGYLPTPTWSGHWIADPGLRRAVTRFLDQERPLIAQAMAEQAEGSPFRQSGATDGTAPE